MVRVVARRRRDLGNVFFTTSEARLALSEDEIRCGAAVIVDTCGASDR